jgi:glycosyltransferase involved in cell wall biosynthesis
LWDSRTAAGVDRFVAISDFIGRRIAKAYRRESTVIYPPVSVDAFAMRADKEDFYLAASRLVPYKKMPLIVQAFSQMPDKRLVVIGDGPDFERCRSVAGPNVTLMGYQSTEVLREHMQRAKAFVFAAEEDFGIAPIEAQACGTPVIAFGKGGALETLRGPEHAQPTAVFFKEQSVQAIVDAVNSFEAEAGKRITAQACSQNAQRFNPQRFRTEFSGFVDDCWQQFERSKRGARE